MKIVFLGDSITEGAGTSCKENQYVELIGQRLHCQVVNFGISGTRIAKQTKLSEEPAFDKDFQGRVETLDEDADKVFVFGGVNDYGHGDALFGHFNEKDPYTFYGGLRCLVESLIDKYGKENLNFILPLGMKDDDKPCGVGSVKNHATLSDYVKIMREVLDYYQVAYLDLFHKLPVPTQDGGNEWFCDSVHPNDKGHVWIAEQVITLLTKKKRRVDCFFGLHFDAHANKNSQYVGKDINVDELERLFKEVRPDFVQCDAKGHPGLTSFHTRVGTSAKLYGDGMQEWRRISKKYGALLYAHYSGMMDMEAVQTHPEWAKVDKNGNISNEYTSMFGPYVDELLIPQLKELAGDYGLDGAWLDGECWGAHPDYSERTQKLFNEKTGLDAEKDTREFIDFCRQGFRDYVAHYITEVKKEYPDFEMASNWMYSSQMPEKASLPVDFISGDLWPTDSVNSARKEARIMASQNRPWDLMAWGFSFPVHYQKGAKQLMQEAAAVISQGGGFQVYCQQDLQYGLRDGWMISDLAEVAKFCRERKAYCWKGESNNDVCVIYSTKAYYDSNGERLFGGGGEYNDDFGGMLKNLLDNGYSTDVMLSQVVTTEKMQKYGLIVLSNHRTIEEELKQSLIEYVKGGGNLVLTGADTVVLFADILHLQCSAPTREGAVLEVYAKEKRTHVQANYVQVEECGQVLEYMLKGESAMGELVGNPPPAIYFKKRIPAALRMTYGKGTVTVVPFDFGFAYATGKTYQLKKFGTEVYGGYQKRKVVCDKSWLEVNLTTKNEVEYVHLISLLGEHETEIVKTYDDIPPIYDIKVEFRTDKTISKVRLLPEDIEVVFEKTATGITFTVPRVEIYTIVGIE